ncbi:16S rRNA (uracil(1498)-N(3))-methyltransferase [Enterovirga rhinocerotis]|uniref:Ribosomal RNA small subunit methyltransferase E n=1 Tax=Enterovirga rhinocerotis TaxID=1339210 RepID=A0A4R7C985_9HYPH|nr:16S rRNA (uracil(1498)-N(3))-methyltransferase [Enterovirga rhinocerotis]TDR93895.1 16S rRNA (uracil1498-N3)-methyltransferase [Enterovirga rhinocerotis]
MAEYDFAAQRLFVDSDLAADALVPLERQAAHYLLSVLRLGAGDAIHVFNGRDGEWRAVVEPSGRKAAHLRVGSRVREQTARPDLALLFAPLKHARLDYMVQKAVEMGVSELRPVLTRRTVATRVNLERMRANAVEAAEQCGVLALPGIVPEARLPQALDALPADRLVVFCDEDAPVVDPVAALASAGPAVGFALVIGPEGGFDPSEREAILARPRVCRLSLGPRILRADTAAVAALAVLQSALGDWR